MSTIRRSFLAAAAVYAAMFLVESATADTAFVKRLKELGYPIEDCQYCHLDRAPKKDRAHEVNKRGKWLFAEKQRRGVRTIDPEWLKDYPGGKEQK